MRGPTDRRKLESFMDQLGRRSTGPGDVYLTGGASLLLLGVRASTADIDIKLDPEPPGAFQAIARMKDELDVNVELAAPDDFIPALSDWKLRSTPIRTVSGVSFHHYDFTAQALSKISRGHERDLRDVHALIQRGRTTPEELRQALADIAPRVIRYPQLDIATLRARLTTLLNELTADD